MRKRLNVCQLARKYARQEFVPDVCRTPTDTPPGSMLRVAIYAARVQNGEEIFHADDRSDMEGVASTDVNLRRGRIG